MEISSCGRNGHPRETAMTTPVDDVRHMPRNRIPALDSSVPSRDLVLLCRKSASAIPAMEVLQNHPQIRRKGSERSRSRWKRQGYAAVLTRPRWSAVPLRRHEAEIRLGKLGEIRENCAELARRNTKPAGERRPVLIDGRGG